MSQLGYKLFGAFFIIRTLYELKAPESIQEVMPIPAERVGMTMRAVPYDQSEWASPFGKGRVEVVGAPVVPGTVRPVTEFSADTILNEDEDRPPSFGGFGDAGFLRQFGEFVTKVMAATQVAAANAMPPCEVGDVVIFKMYSASRVPGEDDLFVVPGNAVLAVVTGSDFVTDPVKPHYFVGQAFGGLHDPCGLPGCGGGRSDEIHLVVPGGE